MNRQYRRLRTRAPGRVSIAAARISARLVTGRGGVRRHRGERPSPCGTTPQPALPTRPLVPPVVGGPGSRRPRSRRSAIPGRPRSRQPSPTRAARRRPACRQGHHLRKAGEARAQWQAVQARHRGDDVAGGAAERRLRVQDVPDDPSSPMSLTAAGRVAERTAGQLRRSRAGRVLREPSGQPPAPHPTSSAHLTHTCLKAFRSATAQTARTPRRRPGPCEAAARSARAAREHPTRTQPGAGRLPRRRTARREASAHPPPPAAC